MKANHLSIMSLEEYEPNPEFVGRNFNAGEVIQLVLRAPRTGHWLGFRSVQMVMMHELAHCKQMNHSGAFWAVRNQFANELRKLWEQNYTGDGFWGRGKTLLSGQYEPVSGLSAEIIPRSLCGGTFRSWTGRKRKRKEKGQVDGAIKRERLSYAERQQRRIAKKFGTHGMKLGDDTETRIKLEDGKTPKGKPRVAGSARGRELRAAAALARFSSQKGKEEDMNPEKDPDETASETESEDEDFGAPDRHGKGMIKVCEDEDRGDIRVKQELEELQDLNNVDLYTRGTSPSPSSCNLDKNSKPIKMEEKSLPSYDFIENSKLIKIEKNPSLPHDLDGNSKLNKTDKKPLPQRNLNQTTTSIKIEPNRSPSPSQTPTPLTCPICSLANPSRSTICSACNHVLDQTAHPNYWRCASATCSGSAYVNAGDYGRCGICGARRGG